MAQSTKSRLQRALAEMDEERHVEEIKSQTLACDDPVQFCTQQLGWQPYAYQEKFLRDQSQFVLLRWCRQSGKSTTIAALALHEALKAAYRRIIVVSPSLRQSKKLVQKASQFIEKLGRWILQGRYFKSKIELINGSSIESLPNSPETIRGESANLIVIDEMCFAEKANELYDAVIYSLTTTNGRLIMASTPGSRDSLFYEMCFDEKKYPNISRHHITWEQALTPNGPLQPEIVENIRVQTASDPWRWRREMEAEFAEDEDSWLPMSLITSCVDENLEQIPDEFYTK